MSDGSCGRRVTELRAVAGLTRAQLAGRLGRSTGWVSKVERGVLPLTDLRVLREVAAALDVRLADRWTALHRDTARLWAAQRADGTGKPEYPYRAEEALGGTDLFRIGSRTLHVVGDTQVAAEARQALAAGDVPGWTLKPVRPSLTPLHVLQPLLATRYYGILSRNGFSTVEEVEATPDIGLLTLNGAGMKFIDAVHTAIADLGLGEIADLPVTAPSPADQAAHRRQLLTRLLESGPALRNRDLVEPLARSSVPSTALRLIADALNAEPAPPADPAVVALLDTAGEQAILGHYTRTRSTG